MAEAEKLLRDFWAVFHGNRTKYVVHQVPFKKESSGKNKASRVFYALLNPKSKTDKTPRFDVIEVYTESGHINHIENAFGA